MLDSADIGMDGKQDIDELIGAVTALVADSDAASIDYTLCARIAVALGDANIALLRGAPGFSDAAIRPIATYPVGVGLPRVGIDHVLSGAVPGSGSPAATLVAWRWPADRMFTAKERDAFTAVTRGLEPVAACLATGAPADVPTGIDPETGFLSRLDFLERIDHRVGRGVQEGTLLLVGWIAIDADNRLDAPASLVRGSAERLRNVATSHDMLGRIAATRLALWSDHIGATAGQAHANRAIHALSIPAVSTTHRVAGGFASFPTDANSVAALLHRAAAALERARLHSAVVGSSVARQAHRRR